MSVKHPSYVLAGAVAICSPMIPGLLDGQLDSTTAAERFLVALVACWIFGSILSWVMHTYSEQARRAEVMRIINQARSQEDDPGPQVGG